MNFNLSELIMRHTIFGGIYERLYLEMNHLFLFRMRIVTNKLLKE